MFNKRRIVLIAVWHMTGMAMSASAIDIATAKSEFVNSNLAVTLDDVRITNLFDLIDTPTFVLINVEDDTGGIAIFTDPTTAAAYSNALPGDVFDITAEIGTFFGLEEILDGSLGRPAAVLTPKGTNVPPKLTSVPITLFPGIDQQDAGTTPADPVLEALESTQILFENVTIDQVRIHERDQNSALIDPPTILVPDGTSVVVPTVTADDDFKTLRLADGVTPEVDQPTVRIRSSSAPVIGQVIPNGPINVRALVYDVHRTDAIGEGRYRPYLLDIESTLMGDVDYDLDVDATDFDVARAAFTQPAGLPDSSAPQGVQFAGDPILVNSWDDGNVDRDFDVDNTDLLAIIGAVTSPPPAGAANLYTLHYDPASGVVAIDTKGGVLTGYSILGDDLRADAHTALLEGTITAASVELSEADLASSVIGARLSLGAILPTGLSQHDLTAALDSATYTAAPGTGVSAFELAIGNSNAADFDGDGDVDGEDFLAWQRGGSPDPGSATDLNNWLSAFGTAAAPVHRPVPEPSAASIGCWVVLLLRSRRRVIFVV